MPLERVIECLDAWSSSDDEKEENKEEKAVKADEIASKIEAILQSSDNSYHVSELNISYNLNEESKVEIADSEKTKIQAHFNICGAQYEESLIEAKQLYQQLGMQMHKHQEEGCERLAFLQI